MNHSFQQALSQDPHLFALSKVWSKEIISAEPLNGGLTNQCWKITTSDKKSYVWRAQTLVNQKFFIQRDNEFQVLKALESSPFSPAVEALFPHGLLVEWVEGQSLISESCGSIDDVFCCLADLHQFTDFSLDNLAVLPRFDYRQCLDNYWSQMPKQVQTFELRQGMELCQRVSIPLIERTLAVAPACLCHFDLGNYNLVRTAQGSLVTIDWEYASIASPIIDVCTSLLAGGYSIEDGLKSYAHFVDQNTQLQIAIDIDEWRPLIEAWIPLLQMMAVLWHHIAFDCYQRGSDQQAIEQLCLSLQKSGYLS